MTRIKINGIQYDPNSDRAKIWQAIRNYKGSFSVNDIKILCDTSNTNTYNYLNALKRAGYIRKIGRRKTGVDMSNIYVLIKNTGPKHLIERRCIHVFYDPNTEELFTDNISEEELIKEIQKASRVKKPANCKVPTYTNTIRAKVWDYMRGTTTTFTLQDVEKSVNCFTETPYSYLLELVNMKYVEKQEDGSYFLVKDTGPLPPIALKDNKKIFSDPNLPEGEQVFSFVYSHSEIEKIREHNRIISRFRDE